MPPPGRKMRQLPGQQQQLAAAAVVAGTVLGTGKSARGAASLYATSASESRQSL